MPYRGAPAGLGLTWSDGRIVRTAYGERCLAKAPATQEFHRFWDAAHEDLRGVGLSWEGPKTVLFWERPDLDHVALAALIDSLPARVAEHQALRRREAEARKAEAEIAHRAHERLSRQTREAATTSLRDRRWSWSRQCDVDEAHEILARPELDETAVHRLIALTTLAVRNVNRAEGRVAVAHAAEMRLASDPSVQVAAHEAVRAITEYDQDWASTQNGIGWSKATTVDGHVLAGLDRLTVEQTSHALRLLRVHRKQVPDRLIPRIFALPAQQGALSLSA